MQQHRALIALVLSLSTAGGAFAQATSSPRPLLLDTLVASAERSPIALGATVAPTTVLHATQFVGSTSTIADVLAQLPGITASGFDAFGRDAAPVVRGFYGGGEAEYLIVMVDGRPVSRLLNGTVPWHAIPLVGVDRVELTRGGASPQFGDAAIGGVLNIVTSGVPSSRLTLRPSTGVLAGVSGRGFALEGELDSGERPHSGVRRLAGSARGDVWIVNTQIDLSYADFDIAGPVLRAAGAAPLAAFDSIYRFDAAIERNARLTIGVGDASALRVVADLNGIDHTRTFNLSTEYATTQRRRTDTYRVLAAADRTIGRSLHVGGELSHAGFASAYSRVAAGTRDDYRSAVPDGSEVASGSGSRSIGALFGQLSVSPHARLRAIAGVRGDLLLDAFEDSDTDTRGALSPQLGLNYQFVDRPAARGHGYLSLSTSFKAPTPDQLFDQRVIEVPGMGGVSFSNPDLEPQRLRGVETGVSQQLVVRDGVVILLNGSWFRSRMRNEIDFDLSQFRYANIGRSEHGGWEVGGRVTGNRGATAYASYSVQWAETRTGEFAGNNLKGIPGRTLSLGGRLAVPLNPELRYTRNDDLYLDDANTRALTFERLDLGLSHAWRGWTVAVLVTNVTDEDSPVGGYMDNAGSGLEYVFPGAPRRLELSLARR